MLARKCDPLLEKGDAEVEEVDVEIAPTPAASHVKFGWIEGVFVSIVFLPIMSLCDFIIP
jgi:hypothetical protein